MNDRIVQCSHTDTIYDTKANFAITKPITSGIQSWALFCIIIYLVWCKNELMCVKTELNAMNERLEKSGCYNNDKIKVGNLHFPLKLLNEECPSIFIS